MSEHGNTRLTDGAYVELVKSLFTTMFPTLIMGAAFLIVGARVVAETRDLPLLVMLVLGGLAVLGRIAVLLAYSGLRTDPEFNAVRAGRAERRFAVPYYAFAVCFGLLMARAFPLAGPDSRLLLIGLIFGYGAGVAAGISLRPWICVPSILLAILPATLVIAIVEGGRNAWLAVLIAVFLAGGIESMLRRYRSTAKRLALEQMMSMVSERDELTGLSNKLSMFRRINELSAAAAGWSLVAVHCIEFEGLSQINADFGYPRGDELLKAAAQRATQMLPPGAFAARLGGASFAIVQAMFEHAKQAEIIAHELQEALSRPYAIAGGVLRLTVRIGVIVEYQRAREPAELLERAYQVLKQARSERLGVMLSEHIESIFPR